MSFNSFNQLCLGGGHVLPVLVGSKNKSNSEQQVCRLSSENNRMAEAMTNLKHPLNFDIRYRIHFLVLIKIVKNVNIRLAEYRRLNLQA